MAKKLKVPEDDVACLWLICFKNMLVQGDSVYREYLMDTFDKMYPRLSTRERRSVIRNVKNSLKEYLKKHNPNEGPYYFWSHFYEMVKEMETEFIIEKEN